MSKGERLTLKPLGFREAVADILKVKPQKSTTKKKPRKR